MWPLARIGAGHLAPEVGHDIVRVGAHTADEVVSHAAVLLRRDLVGDEVEAVVHLDLVGVDDLAAEAQREVHRQLGLACGRRAHHHHNLAPARSPQCPPCMHAYNSRYREALKSPQSGCVFDPGNMQNASSLPSQLICVQLLEVQLLF
jgi:hypothetical protein